MKKKPNYGELAFFVVFLLFSVAMFLQAIKFTPAGRLFPVIILGTLIVLLVIKVISILNPKVASTLDAEPVLQDTPLSEGEGGEESGERNPQATFRTELYMIGWIVSLVLLVYFLGFMVAIPIFLFAFLMVQGKHGLKVSLVTTAAVYLGIYLLFVVFLNASFPAGRLF